MLYLEKVFLREQLIYKLILPVISVFFGLISILMIDSTSWPPCGRALATSKSCRVTSCTISFFLCTSPLGKGTYSSAYFEKDNSYLNR